MTLLLRTPPPPPPSLPPPPSPPSLPLSPPSPPHLWSGSTLLLFLLGSLLTLTLTLITLLLLNLILLILLLLVFLLLGYCHLTQYHGPYTYLVQSGVPRWLSAQSQCMHPKCLLNCLSGKIENFCTCHDPTCLVKSRVPVQPPWSTACISEPSPWALIVNGYSPTIAGARAKKEVHKVGEVLGPNKETEKEKKLEYITSHNLHNYRVPLYTDFKEDPLRAAKGVGIESGWETRRESHIVRQENSHPPCSVHRIQIFGPRHKKYQVSILGPHPSSIPPLKSCERNLPKTTLPNKIKSHPVSHSSLAST